MKGYTSRRYAGIPVGILIQRDIGKTWIFRIRRGNGYYGSKKGETIQDRFAYFVPDSINNAQGQHARDVFTAAIAAWQGLSAAIKKWWDTKAKRLRLNMSGYNLYIKKYMKDNL